MHRSRVNIVRTFSLEPAAKKATASFRWTRKLQLGGWFHTLSLTAIDCIPGWLGWCLWTLWLATNGCEIVVTSWQLGSLLGTAGRWWWTGYCTVWQWIALLNVFKYVQHHWNFLWLTASSEMAGKLPLFTNVFAMWQKVFSRLYILQSIILTSANNHSIWW